MNTEKASRKVMENLSVKTYEKLLNQLRKGGNKAPTMELAKAITQRYFEGLLDNRFDYDFEHGNVEFEEGAKNIKPFVKELSELERDDLRTELRSIYSDGYFYGYIAAARDIEAMLNSLEEPKDE
jgi:hypothetical protein